MILLDTHVLIWWMARTGRLSDEAAAAVARSVALVSPISFWELAVLMDRGRVALDREISRWCRDLLASGTVRTASLTPSAAIAAAQLPRFHGDPADRLIYATARDLGIPLVSKDEKIREYASRYRDVEVIW
jgi:PIN domain nuclease of toxin-antitoxin system